MIRGRQSLIIVTGGEGAGKTTIMAGLLPHTPRGAKLDAEDVGQVNPFIFDRPFLELLWNNVSNVITNFWAAGYTTVITGSFLEGDTHDSYQQFRTRLPEDVAIYLVHLQASRPIRDQRRINRPKPTSTEWRERVDSSYPDNDTSLRDNAHDYRYIAIDNNDHQIQESITAIKTAIPEIYGQTATSDGALQTLQ